MERQVEEWLRNYEERALELRNRLFRKMEGQTIAVFRVRADFLQMYGNQIMGYSLYHSLGLTPPYKLAKQFEINGSYHSTVINLDELPFSGRITLSSSCSLMRRLAKYGPTFKSLLYGYPSPPCATTIFIKLMYTSGWLMIRCLLWRKWKKRLCY